MIQRRWWRKDIIKRFADTTASSYLSTHRTTVTSFGSTHWDKHITQQRLCIDTGGGIRYWPCLIWTHLRIIAMSIEVEYMRKYETIKCDKNITAACIRQHTGWDSILAMFNLNTSAHYNSHEYWSGIHAVKYVTIALYRQQATTQRSNQSSLCSVHVCSWHNSRPDTKLGRFLVKIIWN